MRCDANFAGRILSNGIQILDVHRIVVDILLTEHFKTTTWKTSAAKCRLDDQWINKQECQPLLKAKCCPRVAQSWMSDKHHTVDPVYASFVRGSAYSTGLYRMSRPVQHFVNPGQLVQAVSWTQTQKTWPDLWPMTLILNRLLQVVNVHVRAKFH